MSPRREAAMVPDARFDSYYGRPILKQPAWRVPDVPAYLFLGGMAGASASMAAVAGFTGDADLVRVGRYVSSVGALASVGALVHDLGRPMRFLNMLRVVKVTSPLSVGSWILAPFSGLASVSAGTQLLGRFGAIGTAAGVGAGLLGPAMCTYTSVLLADTAVPAWHDAYRELPFVFAGSALTSAAGAVLISAPTAATGPARRMALLGAGIELAAASAVERNLGLTGEPYRTGRAGRLLTAGKVLTVAGAALSLAAGRSRLASVLAGTALLAAGACTRFGVYHAGVESTKDPKYVVEPQRERIRRQAPTPAGH